MIKIKELNGTNKQYVEAISELHMRAFPGFFLTQLGIGFLRTLYSGYLEDENSGIIVAEDDTVIVGFIAYSNNYSQFYKGFIKNHIIKFALCSLGAALRHPSFVKRILGAFKKSESVIKNERYVELASICVDPLRENKGIGSALIDQLKDTVDFNNYAYINLETDADDNDVVNLFYVKNGFKLARSFTTAEGRIMNEYRFRPGE